MLRVLLFDLETKNIICEASVESIFQARKRLKHSGNYTLRVLGDRVDQADSIQYSLTVIPDRYPEISVDQFVDSVAKEYVFFNGRASDDYGLSKLSFFIK